MVKEPDKTAKAKEVKEKEKVQAIGKLEQSLEVLQKFGGFQILKNSIRTFKGKSGEQRPGVDNLDPDRPGRREIFLKDSTFKSERKQLKERLKLLRDQLAEAQDMEQLLSASIERTNAVSELINKNLKIALDSIREMERSYRMVAAFFVNAEKSKGAKVENVDIMNASMEQLRDKDNPIFLTKISDQLESFYNKLDLMDNYSLLVVPGFLGSAQDVDRFAEVAARHKVVLVTDFADVDSVEDAISMFESYQLSGADEHKAYVCIVCNYIAARPGFEELGEPPMFIPASAALAGKMYLNPTQVPSAGEQNGVLREVSGVKFPLKHTELGEIADSGLIPITWDYGKAMAFGDSTIFDGDNPGYRKYSVVRTFDFVTKTLKDLLNRYTFRLIDFNLTRDIRKQINDFLEKNKGDGRLIQSFNIKSIDKIDVDKVRINIDITPWFPAKLFEIELTGREGAHDEKDWQDKVSAK